MFIDSQLLALDKAITTLAEEPEVTIDEWIHNLRGLATVVMIVHLLQLFKMQMLWFIWPKARSLL